MHTDCEGLEGMFDEHCCCPSSLYLMYFLPITPPLKTHISQRNVQYVFVNQLLYQKTCSKHVPNQCTLVLVSLLFSSYIQDMWNPFLLLLF